MLLTVLCENNCLDEDLLQSLRGSWARARELFQLCFLLSQAGAEAFVLEKGCANTGVTP